MKTTFTTEKLEKRIKYTRILSVLMVSVGLLMVILGDFTKVSKLQTIWSILDGLFFIIMGIATFIPNYKKLKLVSGSFITFYKSEKNNAISFDFKSRDTEGENIQSNDLNSIIVNLKNVELVNNDGSSQIIEMTDYAKFIDKKAIKKMFGLMKNEIESNA